MEIESIRNKALRRFFVEGNTRGLDGNLVGRLRNMLAFMVAADRFDELTVPPNYGLHAMSGDRAGTWAMTLTRNWRLTFKLIDELTLSELDLEDYH